MHFFQTGVSDPGRLKIQIISINFAPEFISTGLYTSEAANWLSARGHDVRVVSAVPFYPEWKVFPGYSAIRYKREITPQGVSIVHCPLYVPKIPTGKRRILHYLSFALTAFPVAIARSLLHRPDLTLVVAPSLVSAPVGWISGRLCAGKIWLHIQDFELEAAHATKLIQKEGPLFRIGFAFEKWCLKRFDLLSTISAPMTSKLSEKQVPEERIYEFRNWANLMPALPDKETSDFKSDLGISSRYVALYSGTIANKQGLEVILDSARLLQSREDLTFLICGEGPALERLRDLARGLRNVEFRPLQPKERLGELLGLADIHLLPQIAAAADLMLPSKLSNMLASGRAIIATADVGTALANEVAGAGVVVPPGAPDILAATIENLLENGPERCRLGERAKQRAIDRWDKEKILTALERRIVQLVAGSEK